MLVVIDLSKKMVGYNLFKTFFYQLENDGALFFANNPLANDDEQCDYNELYYNIKSFLFNNSARNWDLCVMYDMEDQYNDFMRNSIVSNIHNIKKHIINPLGNEYSFGGLYYVLLDDIKRNFNGEPIDPRINFAIDFDAMGYVKRTYDIEYSSIVFTSQDIEKVDEMWEDAKAQYAPRGSLTINDPNGLFSTFRSQFKQLVGEKIEENRSKYGFNWYSDRLSDVYHTVVDYIDNAINQNIDSPTNIEYPSKKLKETLKWEMSSYKEQFANIIRISMDGKNSNIPHQILSYRRQIEIFGLLVYLAKCDKSEIFGHAQMLNRENHYEIESVLNEANLCEMLASYGIKLRTESEKLGKYTQNEIEYTEFAPRTFDLAQDIKAPPMRSIKRHPSYFAKPGDDIAIDRLSEHLIDRHEQSIKMAEKRMLDLTAQLRVQKESASQGRPAKASVPKLSAEIDKHKTHIDELERKIVSYRQTEIPEIDRDLYKNRADQIKALLAKRIKISTVVKNTFLLLAIMAFIYPVLQLINFRIENSLLVCFLIWPIPALVYLVTQFVTTIKLQRSIMLKIKAYMNDNEATVRSLLNIDTGDVDYIHNLYDLIMEKKYVDDCTKKIAQSGSRFKQFDLHQKNLTYHIEISRQLVRVLAVDINKAKLQKLDQLPGIDGNKGVENNPIYCPLSYLSVVDEPSTTINVDNKKNVELTVQDMAFIEKMIVNRDKEYAHA